MDIGAEKKKVQGTDKEKAVGSLMALRCSAGGVCGCGRFDISGAFNPGTGNRWCWEIKLLSPQPCQSVPGVSASLSLSLYFSPCSVFFQCLSLIRLAAVSYHLASPFRSFVSVVGTSENCFPPHSSCVFVKSRKGG